MKIRSIYYTIFVILLISLSSCSMVVGFSPISTDIKRNIGLNMYASQVDSVKDRMFADLMKMSRDWKDPGDYDSGNGNYGNGDILDEVNLDENGWPLCDAECVVFAGIGSMNGSYYFEFECDDEEMPIVSLGYTAGATKKNITYVDGKYSCDIIIETEDSTSLLLTIRNTANGFKNVKMMRPIEPGSEICYELDTNFTTQSKTLVEDVGVIRWMWAVDGWNGAWQTEWSDRIQPDYCSFQRGEEEDAVFWAGKGMAWEYAISFCNETGKDAWINMPLAADDDYIRELATLWKKNYTVPNGKIYWEYSNEATWAYTVHSVISDWLREQGEAEANAGGCIAYDGVSNINVMGVRYYTNRAVEMSKIWREVWGDEDMMTRIRPVLSGHADYNDQNQWGLDFIYRYYGNKDGDNVSDPHPVNYFFYGTGGDFYTGDDPYNDSEMILYIDGEDTTVKGSEIELYEVYAENESCMAKTYGLKRCAYEGGVWTSEENYQLESIRESMILYYRLWDKYDGDLLCYYVTTGGEDGGTALGLSMDGLDLDTPKNDAMNYLTNTSKETATGGTLAPCTIEGANFSTHYVPWYRPLPQFMESTGSIVLGKYSKYVGYLIKTENPLTYGIQLNYKNYSTIDVEIIVNGESLFRGNLNSNGDNLLSDTYTFFLDEGLHSVAVRVYAEEESDYFELNNVTILEL